MNWEITEPKGRPPQNVFLTAINVNVLVFWFKFPSKTMIDSFAPIKSPNSWGVNGDVSESKGGIIVTVIVIFPVTGSGSEYTGGEI